jgi:ABC-type multidrug transport system ATPase subunit
MTLLLGPPQSGKSTLLKALSGRLHPSGLSIQGNVSHATAALVSLEPTTYLC